MPIRISGLSAALVLGVFCLVMAGPAQAQFVCVGNANGSLVAPATASGDGANAGGGANVACGTGALANGVTSFNTATGFQADARGGSSTNTATGGFANASGDLSNNTATGDAADARGNSSGNIATGANSSAFGDGGNNLAIGTNAFAGGNASANVAFGFQATALGVGSSNVAIGGNAQAFGDGISSTAIGTGAHANLANSSAFGAGATVTRANQQVFGTASNTYTMSGVTSAASKAAQSGKTQVITTDAVGNLASADVASLGLATSTDLSGIQSQINHLGRRDSELSSGIAMAISMQNPDLTGSERFGMAANWGTFDGSSGLGLALMGVLGHDLFMAGDRAAISGSFGTGFEGGSDDNVYGGRVGLQWTHR